MMTVAQVSKRTGVSVRTLHHYDQIGLLRPTEVTEAGYRLYDDGALDKLYMILVYRELGLSLNEIGSILDAPDYDRNRVLEHQIKLMQERVEKLQNRISFARGMSMGYKKDIFAVFAYEFELSRCTKVSIVTVFLATDFALQSLQSRP